MILPTHDLRSHITRRSTRLLTVIRIPDASNPKISYPQIALVIENDILGLNISVQDTLIMDVLEGVSYAGNKESCLFLGETSVP